MSESRQFNFANFARSTLLESITADQTELSVQAEFGARFPTADATYDEIFAVVLSAGSAYEVVYVTAKDGDVFTVERGKEGTTAAAWPAGTTLVHTVTAGFFEQRVDNPPGNNPVPVITSLTPSSVDEDSGGQDITINGTGFLPSSTATFDGNSRAVVYVSATTLTLTLLAADVETAGTFDVVVTNPAPGGGDSNAEPFGVAFDDTTPLIWDPDQLQSSLVLSNGNLTVNKPTFTGGTAITMGNIGKSVGKWYWEILAQSNPSSSAAVAIGIAPLSLPFGHFVGEREMEYAIAGNTPFAPSAINNNTTTAVNGVNTNYVSGDVLGFALNMDDNELTVYLNNVMHHTFTGLADEAYFPAMSIYENAQTYSIQDVLTYAPPFGFSTLDFDTDPFFANVVSLMHFDSKDGVSTAPAFTDVTGKTWSLEGSPTVETTQYQFGTAFEASSADRISTGTSADFGFGTGDYTVEFWMYPTTIDLQVYRGIVDFRTVLSTMAPNINFNADALEFREAENVRITTSGITVNTEYHVAVCREGNNTRMFLDGVQVGSTYTTNNDLGSTAPVTLGGIGAGEANSGLTKFLGFLDEFRVTKGVARYTANFTPPVSMHPDQ